MLYVMKVLMFFRFLLVCVLKRHVILVDGCVLWNCVLAVMYICYDILYMYMT
jgi:hypothetical protein